MSSAWLTSNTPPWLVLVFIGIAGSAYLTVALLVLGGRLRTAAARECRPQRTAPLWVASWKGRKEVTS